MRPDPAEEDRPEPVQVPDDASALARDVEALRRERRALARRSRLRRWVAGASGAGLGAPLVAAVLGAVLLVAALPVVFRPSPATDPAARPQASPAVPPGRVGGLLPDVGLDTPAGPLRARSTARPGLLVLVPGGCGCDDAVVEVVQQAREFTRNVRVVVDGRVPGATGEADRLRRRVARGLVRSGTDPAGALTQAYGATGVTALLLADDGVVLDVLPDVRAGQRLESRLSRLGPPPG